MPEEQRISAKLVDAVTAPLGFYVLALLIVETFLAAVVIGGTLDSDNQFNALMVGVGMFVFVILVVTILVWNKPENLTFDKQAHLVRSRAEYGTNTETVPNRDALLPSEPTKE